MIVGYIFTNTICAGQQTVHLNHGWLAVTDFQRDRFPDSFKCILFILPLQDESIYAVCIRAICGHSIDQNALGNSQGTQIGPVGDSDDALVGSNGAAVYAVPGYADLFLDAILLFPVLQPVYRCLKSFRCIIILIDLKRCTKRKPTDHHALSGPQCNVRLSVLPRLTIAELNPAGCIQIMKRIAFPVLHRDTHVEGRFRLGIKSQRLHPDFKRAGTISGENKLGPVGMPCAIKGIAVALDHGSGNRSLRFFFSTVHDKRPDQSAGIG